MAPDTLATPLARERIAREFDDRGPAACVAEVAADLRQNNPELLDIARRCAASLVDESRAMLGFAMFYRLLIAPAAPAMRPAELSPLPRVTPRTRAAIVRQIDGAGVETFTKQALADLERDDPELLLMADAFASRHPDYLGLIQGFALFYRALLEQSAADRRAPH